MVNFLKFFTGRSDSSCYFFCALSKIFYLFFVVVVFFFYRKLSLIESEVAGIL